MIDIYVYIYGYIEIILLFIVNDKFMYVIG